MPRMAKGTPIRPEKLVEKPMLARYRGSALFSILCTSSRHSEPNQTQR